MAARPAATSVQLGISYCSKISNAMHVVGSNLNGNPAMINRNKRDRSYEFAHISEMNITANANFGLGEENNRQKIQRVREQRSVVTVR